MTNLAIYKQLEQQTLLLDERNDEVLAERIRAVMDFVWFQRLSAAERDSLNARENVIIEPTAQSQISMMFIFVPAFSAPSGANYTHTVEVESSAASTYLKAAS